jgi:hypothetical protein
MILNHRKNTVSGVHIHRGNRASWNQVRLPNNFVSL